MDIGTLGNIFYLRGQNYSYQFIADIFGISVNTVKSLCRRHGVSANGPRKTKAEKQSAVFCKNCHQPITNGGRKDRIFCSDACRRKWHKAQQKKVEKGLDSSGVQSD